MKQLFNKYRPVLQFIGVFLGVYLLLIFLYSLYLQYDWGSQNHPDYITNLVAEQARSVSETLGYETKTYIDVAEPWVLYYVDNQFVLRVVEGCNSVSVLLLFAAFVMAFWQGLKRTLLFLFAGVVLLYGFNVVRVALFGIGLYEYPEYSTFLHDIAFPLFIYGVLFALWIVWIRSKMKNR